MSEAPVLSYYLPKVQKPHTVLRIPSSHTIFVGPAACMRRHYIHAAQYGDLDHVSFMSIHGADVISGDYEEEMVRAVAELSKRITPRPRVFLLAVFCVDDLLGTDEAAVLERLEREFPDCRFAMEHIAPLTMDDDKNAMMKKKSNLYGFLKPETDKDNGVLFMGNYVSLDPACEFLSLLKGWGLGPVREIFNCKTYEEYQNMAKSRIAIGLRKVSGGGVRYVEQTLGIPFHDFPAGYDADTVAAHYQTLANLLGQPKPVLEEAVRLAKQDARDTAAALQGLPLAVDSKASLMPFALACALQDYGFAVKYVFTSRKPFREDTAFLERVTARGAKALRSDDITNGGKTFALRESLALGSDCAGLLGSAYTVDIWHDEGFFGFHGIHRLMKAIRVAAGLEKEEGNG